jgi:hypothetical protein
MAAEPSIQASIIYRGYNQMAFIPFNISISNARAERLERPKRDLLSRKRKI